MLCFEPSVVSPRCPQCDKQWCSICDVRWRLSQRKASIQATCPFCRQSLMQFDSPTVFVSTRRRGLHPFFTKLLRVFSCILLILILLFLPMLDAYMESEQQVEVYVYIGLIFFLALFLLCYFMNRAGLEGDFDTVLENGSGV